MLMSQTHNTHAGKKKTILQFVLGVLTGESRSLINLNKRRSRAVLFMHTLTFTDSLQATMVRKMGRTELSVKLLVTYHPIWRTPSHSGLADGAAETFVVG